MTTWSAQQIDSLPSGVRALPRGLRVAWAGAASASVGRGSSTPDARRHGDDVVDLLKRGLADAGLSLDALEEWHCHNTHAHPLMHLLQEQGLGDAAGQLHQLTLPKDGALSKPGDFASWLADQLQALVDAAKNSGAVEASENDGGPGSTPGILAISPQGDLIVVTEDGNQQPAPKGLSRLASAAALAATLAGAPQQAHTDGQTWRADRIDFDLTVEGKDAVERALSRGRRLAKRGDEATFNAIVDQLRKDGFDDYVTPEGYLRVRVKAARSGVQQYSDGISVWGELRPIEEVFSTESLASWSFKPFTNDHPPDFVGIHNWGIYGCGVVGEARRVPGPDGDDYVEVTLVVNDFDTLVAIKGGKVELSAGYTANIKAESGRDHKGREYRYRQTGIYINHLSLVDRGRAGPLARISLDGFAWQVAQPIADAVGTQPHTDQHENDMQFIDVPLTDGTTIKLSPEDAAKLKAAQDKAIQDAVEQAKRAAAAEVSDAAKPQLDAFKAQLDAMQLQMTSMQTDKATTDAKLVQLEAENARLVADAEARTKSEVIAAIKQVCPKLAIDSIKGRKSVDGAERPATLADYKAAAVKDLAPHLASAIDAYAGNGDAAFTTFVDTLYGPEVARARANPSTPRVSDGDSPRRARQTGDMNSLRSAGIHGAAARPN